MTEATRGLRIGFLGDLFIAQGKPPPSVGDDLGGRLARCDHVVANLEGPVTTREPGIAKKGPLLKQDETALDFAASLGVDLLAGANNHIADYGAEGIRDTLAVASARGLEVGGCGVRAEHAYRPLRVSNEEVSVSLIFAAEDGFGCISAPAAPGAGYAWIFHPALVTCIEGELAAGRRVVLCVHAGAEHIDRPLPQWRQTYKRFIDLGVSAIVAHHPHRMQGVEWHHGAPILYSLGNFYFDNRGRHRGWKARTSQVPILEFKPEGGPALSIEHAEFSAERGAEAVGLTASAEPSRRTEALSRELEAEATYRRNLADDVRALWKSRYVKGIQLSLPTFLPNLSGAGRLAYRLMLRILLGRRVQDPLVLSHFVDIESHRWAIAERLRLDEA